MHPLREDVDRVNDELLPAELLPTPNMILTTDSLKMVRETLCVAQTGVTEAHRDRLQRLIDDIDRQRPLGPDGKHGDRHTKFCGCESMSSEHHAHGATGDDG